MRALRTLQIIGLSVVATPAASAWLSPATTRVARTVRAVASVVTLAAVPWLACSVWRWPVVAELWAVLAVTFGLAVAAAETAAESGTAADEAPAWARSWVRAAAPIGIGAVLALLVVRLGVVAALNPTLARFDPQGVDLGGAAALAFLDLLWLIPLALAILATALRRSRQTESATWPMVWIGAFLVVLVARDLLFQLGFRALGSQVVDGIVTWSTGAAMVVSVALACAAGVATVDLAAGRGGLGSRVARAVLLLVGALASSGLLAGGGPLVQFAWARALERSADAPGALAWYTRVARSSDAPELVGYLRHRIGLLRYHTGDRQGAAEAWRAEVAGERTDRAVEAEHYLEHLVDPPTPGARQVLGNMRFALERRDSYCAPNTLALVFGLLGRPVSAGEIGELASYLGSGTSHRSIPAIARSYGFDYAFAPNATIDDVYWLIDRGLPALIFIPGHVYAVVGYDRDLETIITFDTARRDAWSERPRPDFEREWAADHWLMGVVIPVGATEATERFGAARSRAAAQWWLGRATGNSEHWRRALEIDPGFAPAALSLVVSDGERPWKRGEGLNVDPEALRRELVEMLGRPYADVDDLSHRGLGVLFGIGDFEGLEEVVRLLEQRGATPFAAAWAARAAKARRDDLAASHYFAQAPKKRLAADEIAREVDRWIAAGSLERASGDLEGALRRANPTSLEWLAVVLENLGDQHPAAQMWPLYEAYLARRPDDVAARLRQAELALELVRTDGVDIDRRRQIGRAAATMTVALAHEPEMIARAREILAGLGAPGAVPPPDRADISAD